MTIKYDLENRKPDKAYVHKAYHDNRCFKSKKGLIRAVNGVMKTLECKNCGGHRFKSNKVIVDFGLVKMFKEVKKKGVFRNRLVEKHVKDVYFIYGIYLRPKGVFSSGGYIKCKFCKWEKKAYDEWVPILVDKLPPLEGIRSKEEVIDDSVDNQPDKTVDDDLQSFEQPPEISGHTITNPRGVVRGLREQQQVKRTVDGIFRTLTLTPNISGHASHKYISVWTFSVDVYYQNKLICQFPVEMKGKALQGALFDGDIAQVNGIFEFGSSLFADEIYNITRDSLVKVVGGYKRI